MAIDFAKTFGANNTRGNVQGNTNAQSQDRPKAQFWINIGYDSGVQDEDGTTRFVSLPMGIPLDTQEVLPTNSRNKQYAAFQQARNELLDQIMAAARDLEPGQDAILNLQVQLRRVNDEVPETAIADNPFVRKLALVG